MKMLLVDVLMILGTLFCLIAAVGILRFKDLYIRIHAATKAGAFGGSLVALASGIHFSSLSGWVQSLLLIVFFYITAPVAAHMLSRQKFNRDSNR